MARKFAGMTRIVNRQSVSSMFSSRIASCRHSRTTRRNRKARAPARILLFAAPSGHDTQEDLRFHHYVMEDDRYYPPRGSSASMAASGIFSSWLTRPALAQSKCRANCAARFHPPVTCRRHCVTLRSMQCLGKIRSKIFDQVLLTLRLLLTRS